MANESKEQKGPDTQEPDSTSERPAKGKDGDPFEMDDTEAQPLHVMPQVPEASPAVRPGGEPKLR